MHLTDEQLNEYLDHETNERPQTELHLAACTACSARLGAFRDLFTEIESLPELGLSPDFAVSYLSGPNERIPLPRSLTLTVTLQAVLTVIAILLAAPWVTPFIPWNTSGISTPSLADVFMQLQSQWATWLDLLSSLTFPAMPEIPVIEVSSLFMIFMVIGVFLVWLVGNGLLLRNQLK